MKKMLFTIAGCLAFCSSFAQYTVLFNDPFNDLTLPGMTSVPDIKTFSYRINATQDSIWFKLETYNAFTSNADFGLMIGLDTNQVVNDGIGWGGNNSSMKYDLALIVTQTIMVPGYMAVVSSPIGDFVYPIVVERPNNYTFIIRAKLSTLDANRTFNLITGGGMFDIGMTKDVYDDAPNTGYGTISTATDVNDIKGITSTLYYPNPTKDLLLWNVDPPKKGNVDIYSLNGAQIKSIPYSEGRIDLRNLPAGTYFVKHQSEIKKIIKN